MCVQFKLRKSCRILELDLLYRRCSSSSSRRSVGANCCSNPLQWRGTHRALFGSTEQQHLRTLCVCTCCTPCRHQQGLLPFTAASTLHPWAASNLPRGPRRRSMWTCVQGVCSWVPGSGIPDLSCAWDIDGSPCNHVSQWGAVWAVCAALFNGSFTAFSKMRRVQRARVSWGGAVVHDNNSTGSSNSSNNNNSTQHQQRRSVDQGSGSKQRFINKGSMPC